MAHSEEDGAQSGPPASPEPPPSGVPPSQLWLSSGSPPTAGAGPSEATPPSGTPRARRSDRSAKAKPARGSFLRELPVLLLIAFVLAFLLRSFVLQVFYIPSSSMEPTLQINDRMVVEKITYRFREPTRGEIAVFEGDSFGTPQNDTGPVARVIRGVGQFVGVIPASARDFVKRVIGLPGDEIVIEDGQVFVNGEPLDEDYVEFGDGASYGPVTVPAGHLFFLGDNRPNSSDSRRSLGFVPRDQLVGRAVVIIWPAAHMGTLTGTVHDVPDERADPDAPAGRDADPAASVPAPASTPAATSPAPRRSALPPAAPRLLEPVRTGDLSAPL